MFSVENSTSENGAKGPNNEDLGLHHMKPVDTDLNKDNISDDIYDYDAEILLDIPMFANVHQQQQQQQHQQQQQVMIKDKKSKKADDTSKKSTCSFIWNYITFNRGLNITTFTILGALTNAMTYSVGSYITSQVSSLEKQFGLSSAEFGFINSANDIGFLFIILLASHFGRDAHIPKLFSCLTLFVGFVVGCISLTYLLRPISYLELLKNAETLNGTIANNSKNITTLTNPYLCSDGMSTLEEANCSSNSVKSHSAYFMFIFFMIILGVCKGPRSSLFPTYVDNNVPQKHHTAVFIGLMICFSILGNGSVYIVGGIISQIPVDLVGEGMTPEDPNWIGAWWIGFLFIAAFTFLFGFPIMFYPREMPQKAQMRNKPRNLDSAVELFVKEATENLKTQKMSFKEKLKELPSSLKGLVGNPVFLLLVIGDCIFVFCFNGLWSFFPKYFEHQFFFPAWKTNYILAIVGLTAAIFGILLGCTIITRLKLEIRGMMVMKITTYCICLSLEVILAFLHCDSPHINNNPMNNSSLQANMTSINDCNCDIRQYFPICGADQENYFSPCHAGCIDGNYFNFTNCSGIPGMSATAGLCPVQCQARYIFIGLITLINLIAMASIPASYLLVIRTPTEKDKALGIGFYSMFLSVGAFLPAPVVFGRIIDSVCILWSVKCNERGACKLYDLDNLRRVLFFPMICGRFASVLILFLALYIYTRKHKKFSLSKKSKKSAPL